MSFKNRVRLPFYITRPQFPTEQNVFRRADGSTKVASVIIRKVFEGETSMLPSTIHERLIIALKHDDVTIEGYRYLGGVSMEGDYEIDWNKFLDFPLGKAEFKVQVTPFNYSNDNCQTCEEVSQVVCEDDDLGTIGEDETHSVPVLANDSICCSPVTISLVTYNTDYLDSCIISGNDIVIHTKASFSTQNNVLLATYRAQCPNGSYDEANIIADMTGTDPTPVCYTPTEVTFEGAQSDTAATFSWTAPSPAPDCGYHWEVLTGFGGFVADGDTTSTSVTVTGLPSDANLLRFYVRSNCCSLDSDYAPPVIFSLPPPSGTELCGQYQLYNNDFPTNYALCTYIDCNGNNQDIYVQGTNSAIICAMQSEPNSPTQIIVPSEVTITYLDLC